MTTGGDQPGRVATGRDSIYSLSIDEAAMLYARAGHPRTPRSIQRYCASGHLDAIKEATALGDKYFISPDSVARHIAQIEELIALDSRTAGRDLSRPVASNEIAQPPRDMQRQEGATTPDVSSPVAPPAPGASAISASDLPRPVATETAPLSQPVAADLPDVSRYVVGLEREVERLLEDREFARDQIRTKDQQIAALLERDRETNILVRGLQQMLSPLLGPARRDPPEQGSSPAF